MWSAAACRRFASPELAPARERGKYFRGAQPLCPYGRTAKADPSTAFRPRKTVGKPGTRNSARDDNAGMITQQTPSTRGVGGRSSYGSPSRRRARIKSAAKRLAPRMAANNSLAPRNEKIEKNVTAINDSDAMATQISKRVFTSGKCTRAMGPYCTTFHFLSRAMKAALP